jgi:hypothetical protein
VSAVEVHPSFAFRAVVYVRSSGPLEFAGCKGPVRQYDPPLRSAVVASAKRFPRPLEIRPILVVETHSPENRRVLAGKFNQLDYACTDLDQDHIPSSALFSLFSVTVLHRLLSGRRSRILACYDWYR